ncbi:MAG: hypothetical protein EAY81_10800 [Bacteroidetes bacterium]|nr:MAG: hypothetical protein EAY81_10800 [Bacteroidota bacterium]
MLSTCKHEPEVLPMPQAALDKYGLTLRWNKGYASETKQMAETGFLWALSFLGAELPKGAFNQAVVWDNNNLIVNFSKLGFNEQGLQALSTLVVHFKQSEEYQKKGAIDLGRFIALTLNSSYHYYAIVGMPKTFQEFKQGKVLDSKRFAATNSSISLVDRIIELPDSNNTDYKKSAYIANECEGRIKEGKGQTAYIEVKEQLPNGQFRFAIYNNSGGLLSSSKGPAGKPAKCLWCHEINIQPLFAEQTDEPGFYSGEMFNYIVNRDFLRLKNYRKTLQSDIDFTRRQDHEYTELLYISFMEPNAERLALEWGMSLDLVKEKLIGLPTHKHSEFEYLGELYFRDEIDKLAPFLSLKPPTSAREESLYEPNLIQ